MNVDDPLRFRPHLVLVTPFGPRRVIAIGIGRAEYRWIHLVQHFPDARLDSQTVGRRAWRLQYLVHDGAEAAQVHAAKVRVVEDQVVKPVGRFALLGGIVEVQHVVLKQGVGEVALRIEPVAAPAQVHVPRKDGPFTRAWGVAIEIKIFVPVILVADQRHGDEVTDRLRQVNVVAGIDDTVGQRARFVEIVDQCLQVAEVLVLAGLFLVTAGAAHIVVHLVKRAVGVAAQSLQPSIITVLQQVRDAEEPRVALEANVECKMTGRPGRGDHLVSERVAHLGLVAVVAQKFDVFDPRAVGAVLETVVAVEIEVVTLLGPAGRTLPVQTDQHVVVKFAEIEKRATRAAERARRHRVFHEQLHHRQQRLNVRIGDDRAQILLGIDRIRKQRPARTVVLRVGRREVIANHLTVGGCAGRNDRAPDAITRRHVAVGAAVVHRHRRFGIEHDPIVERDVRERVEGRQNARGHQQVLVVRRHVRRMADIDDQRAEISSSGAVQCARSRREKIARLSTDLPDAGCHKFGPNQKIRVRRVDIQPLNGQHIGADLEQRAEEREIEVFELNGKVVRVPRGGGRVPC